MFLLLSVCLSVSFSVCMSARLLKSYERILMKCFGLDLALDLYPNHFGDPNHDPGPGTCKGFFISPPPVRGTGYCFRAISLFLCQQHYEKTAGPICMKFSGKVWSDHGTT